MSENQIYKYSAFISYRHIAEDRKWAEWLVDALETYRVPKELQVAGFPERLGKVFRDKDELPSIGDLSSQIENALKASRFLIVICSTETPKSRWISREIELFKELGRGEKIFPMLIEGEPDDSFPPVLTTSQLIGFDEANSSAPIKDIEPIGVDVRPVNERSDKDIKNNELLRIVAGILGCSFDDLKQRDKQRQIKLVRQRNIIASITLGIISILFVVIIVSRLEAEQEKEKFSHNILEANTRESQAKAKADFQEAQKRYHDGDISNTLAYLARSIRLDPDLIASRTLLMNALQQKGMLPAAVIPHKDTVNSASYSMDGKLIVTTSEDKTAQLWDVESGKPRGKTMEHDYAVESAIFSPDGTRILTISNKTARLWDINGILLSESMAHNVSEKFASFSPDGTSIFTISGNTVRLWNGKSGIPSGEIFHDDVVISAAFNYDSTRVLTASKDGTAQLWDTRTGKTLSKIMVQNIISAVFSPNGTRILTESPNTIQLRDAYTGELLREIEELSFGHSASFSPDGKYIVVTASRFSPAELWDAYTGRSLDIKFKSSTVGSPSVYFSPDSTRVAIVSLSKIVRLEDVKTGKELGEAMQHKNNAYSAAFSPDGSLLITQTEDGIWLWNANNGKKLGEVLFPNISKEFIAFSPDSAYALIKSDKTVELWNVKTGKWQGETLGHNHEFRSFVLSPNGDRILTTFDKTARQWDIKTGLPFGEIMVHDDPVISAIYSFDATRILTLSKNTTRLWDAKTGMPLGDNMRHKQEVHSATFSPDGSRILTAASDIVELRNTSSGASIKKIMEHKGLISSAIFSPDGSRILTTSRGDGSILLWDGKTGNPYNKIMQHNNSVYSAAFSSDNTRIITRSRNNVRLWNAQTGDKLGEIVTNNSDNFDSASFSPDGTHILTISNRIAQLWNGFTGESLGIKIIHKDKIYSAIFSHDGTRVLTASKDNKARLSDVKTGNLLGNIMEHEGMVLSAAFSFDDTRVITASRTKGRKPISWIRIWDAYTGKQLNIDIKENGGVEYATFSLDGTRILALKDLYKIRLWDVLPVISGNYNIIAALAEFAIGYKIGEFNKLVAIDLAGQLKNLHQLTSSAHLGESTAESFTRWFLSDPWSRTISPFSRQIVPEYIQQEIAAGHHDQVTQDFPGHPLLRLERAKSEL